MDEYENSKLRNAISLDNSTLLQVLSNSNIILIVLKKPRKSTECY